MNRVATLLVAALLTSTSLFAQTWEIDKTHSNVGFTVTHMVVSKVRGNFNTFSGTVNFDGKDFAAASVDVTIDPKSIDTGNERRDGHLKSPDFFAADSLPEMKFKSTKITGLGEKKFEMVGDLTMRGVTKSVTLTGEFHGTVAMKEGAKAGFSASGKINRQDWGVSWSRSLDAGGLVVSDDVEIVLEIEADKKM
ncbi:MAG: YceI family protein [bacterium]|nr:YceI family protein [bacterium]